MTEIVKMLVPLVLLHELLHFANTTLVALREVADIQVPLPCSQLHLESMRNLAKARSGTTSNLMDTWPADRLLLASHHNTRTLRPNPGQSGFAVGHMKPLQLAQPASINQWHALLGRPKFIGTLFQSGSSFKINFLREALFCSFGGIIVHLPDKKTCHYYFSA